MNPKSIFFTWLCQAMAVIAEDLHEDQSLMIQTGADFVSAAAYSRLSPNATHKQVPTPHQDFSAANTCDHHFGVQGRTSCPGYKSNRRRNCLCPCFKGKFATDGDGSHRRRCGVDRNGGVCPSKTFNDGTSDECQSCSGSVNAYKTSCEEDPYITTFNAIGCPNKDFGSTEVRLDQLDWWKRQKEEDALADMEEYCNLVSDGRSNDNQTEICCGRPDYFKCTTKCNKVEKLIR